MRFLEWFFLAVIVMLLAYVVFFGPASAHSAPPVLPAATRQFLNIKGSDTIVVLNAALAEAFMKLHPEVVVSVTGGGSGTGIAALTDGTCDLAASSREIKPYERARMERGCTPFAVALDALTVAVHPSNPLRYLNMGQLSDIYAGKITDWRDVGGRPGPILAISRERNSGTHVFFLEHVVQREDRRRQFAPAVLMMPSSQAEVDALATTEAGIAYFGLGYLNRRKVAPLAIGRTGNGPFVAPSEVTVLAGSYPLARKLYLYAPGSASTLSGAARAFIDFARSPAGQRIVRECGFVPLQSMPRPAGRPKLAGDRVPANATTRKE